MSGRIITVVGRAKDDHSFLHAVAGFLPDNFSMDGIHSLGDASEVDGKERFIAFLTGEEMGQFTADYVTERLNSEMFAAVAHDDLDSAIAFAKEKYDFGAEDEEAAQRAAELREKFPPLTAQEIEQFVMFDALYETNRITVSRGILNGERILTLVMMVGGPDETRATVLGVLTNQGMSDSLELPWVT